jgi:hypothetical protein
VKTPINIAMITPIKKAHAPREFSLDFIIFPSIKYNGNFLDLR